MAEAKAAAPANERGLVVYRSRDNQEIRLSFDTVRRFLVTGHSEWVTDPEIVVYMGTCKASGLNPFKRDCYLVKYTQRDPAATIVSIDYFRSRARAQPDCVGWKVGIILKNLEEKIEYREGSFLMEGEKVLGGWFKARPKDWTEDFSWTIPLAPFIKKNREGEMTQFWQEEKHGYMICKTVESQGLRRIWPNEFQLMFTEGEIQPLDVTPAATSPMMIPQATEANRNDSQKAAGSTQPADTGDTERAGVERGASTERKEGTGAAPDPARTAGEDPRGSTRTASDALEAVKKWIGQADLATILDNRNHAHQQLKHFGKDEQLDICQALNDRRVALEAAAKDQEAKGRSDAELAKDFPE